MATYNWTDKEGMLRRYPLTQDIQNLNFSLREQPSSVSSMAYTSLSGNDDLGDGSIKRPFRNLSNNPLVPTGTYYCIMSSGVYRGLTQTNSHYGYYADGDVVIDNSILGANLLVVRFYGIKFINGYNNITFDQCRFSNLYVKSAIISDSIFGNNVITASGTITTYASPARYVGITGQNTFVNCNRITINSEDDASIWNCGHFSIFSNCSINFSSYIPDLDYSLFHNCTFSFNGSEPIAINTLEDLLDWMQTVNPKINRAGWTHCTFDDPKFNNPDIGDYSLAFDSPAKNRSYAGTYAGALSIGYAIKADATEADGDFDFSTNVNLTIADNSIVLTNPELEASIESNVKTNLIARELAQAPIFGFYADRNGQYLDTIADLALTTIPATNPLAVDTPYIVENAAIVYDGATILAGERFTTTSVTTFTTDSGGVCREILEAPQRHTIMARFSDGRTVVDLGDPLVIGYWYYVFGTVTYEGNTYTDEVFKATTTNAFTGTGDVVLAMGDELYQHYEPNIKFMSNNVGDVRTGAIVRGNGDPEYERGVGKEFPINSRFIQIKYVIKVNNLKP